VLGNPDVTSNKKSLLTTSLESCVEPTNNSNDETPIVSLRSNENSPFTNTGDVPASTVVFTEIFFKAGICAFTDEGTEMNKGNKRSKNCERKENIVFISDLF
jgi:hypothetical protein